MIRPSIFFQRPSVARTGEKPAEPEPQSSMMTVPLGRRAAAALPCPTSQMKISRHLPKCTAGQRAGPI